MIIIDKAGWQIDGGIPSELVVEHFRIMFQWLKLHDMLTEEGLEELDDGIDEEASINDELVNSNGIKFLQECYDNFLNIIAKDLYGKKDSDKILEQIYEEYKTRK